MVVINYENDTGHKNDHKYSITYQVKGHVLIQLRIRGNPYKSVHIHLQSNMTELELLLRKKEEESC